MTGIVRSADFSSRNGERQLNVIAENTGYGSPARSPKATDYPSDLVAAVRDWAVAGLQGIHEDYRVPAQLVAYLNNRAESTNTEQADVAKVVLKMLNLAPEGGN